MNNIVIIGMPGCGKISVAKAVSRILHKYEFVDLDRLIEIEQRRSINEIFKYSGEAFFRQREALALKNLKDMSMCIIVAGGGAVLNEKNRRNMKDGGTVFFIDRPYELLSREDYSEKPLLKDNPEENLKRIWDERIELYRSCADFIIANDGQRNLKQLAVEIARLHKEKCNEKNTRGKRS